MLDTGVGATLDVPAARRGTMLHASIGALRAGSKPLSDDRTIDLIGIRTVRPSGQVLYSVIVDRCWKCYTTYDQQGSE